MQKRFRLFKKRYKGLHKQHADTIKGVHKHPAFFVPTMTFGVLLIIGVVTLLIINKGDPTPKLSTSNSKVVITNIDGVEHVVPTRAKTVGDLLKRLNITLNEGDVVEPAENTGIVSDNFRVNVYRALPVTIVDGDTETRALSAAATPRSIAKQAGISAYPEDRLNLDPANDFITQGIIGQKLVVERATPVNLNLYGAPIAARTHAKTVGAFLKEKNIKLADGETVQPAQDAPISQTEPIFVNKKGISVQVATEDIAPDKQFVEDDKLTFGVEAVRQQGTPGRRVVTYQTNALTGERTKLQDIIIQQPVASIVARGTYVNIPSDKQGVMAAAGIDKADYTYVDYIVARESGWRPFATNGATWGLCQALPGSKMASAGADWQSNPVTQLKWCSGYAKGRYGSWAAAYNHWLSAHSW
jgi:resuscitation-promoting factor RpfB